MSSSFKSFNVMFKKINIVLFFALLLNLSINDKVFANTPRPSKCQYVNSIKYDNFNIQLCTKVNNKLVWKSQQKPKTLSDLNPYTSWYFASKFNKNKTISSQVNFNIIKSDNFSEKNKEVIAKSLQKSAIFFNNFVNMTDTVTIIMGTEKDLDFWNQQLSVLFNGYYREIWYSITDSFNRFGAESNSANAGLAHNNKPYILFRYGSSIDEYDIKNYLIQTTGHEYAHIIQRLFGNIGDIWLTEGSAEFFGLVIESKGASQYLSHRNKKLANDFLYGESSQINTTNDLYNKIYGGNHGNSAISFGILVIEALIAVYGEDNFMIFLNKVKSGENFDSAFSNVFGYTQRDFLRIMSKYSIEVKNIIKVNGPMVYN